MSYIHPDAAAHQRKRFLRHDAHRFAKPGTPEAETKAYYVIEEKNREAFNEIMQRLAE